MKHIEKLQAQKELYEKADRELNSTIFQCFSSPNGERTLDYLRFITLYSVQGPEVSGQQLAYREGQRALVADIIQRMEKAQNAR